MKKLITLALLIAVFQGRAQNFEGVVKWTMKTEITDPKMKAQMEEAQKKMADPETQAKMKQAQEAMNDPKMKAMMDANPQMKAQMEARMKMMSGGDMSSMMPKGMTIRIKNQNTLSAMEGGAMEGQETLFLKDKGQTVRLDRKNKTYSILASADHPSSAKPSVKITKTGETTKILGHTCTKYTAEMSEAGRTMTQFFWTTTEITDFDMKHLASQRTGQGHAFFYEGLEGVPLRIEMMMPEGKMTMEVSEIKRESQNAADFTIPADYKEVSMTGKY